jgi:hypothetical protein
LVGAAVDVVADAAAVVADEELDEPEPQAAKITADIAKEATIDFLLLNMIPP